MFPSETPRVLICRMSAIGDTILTLPVACAIRERYPRAFIAWAVEQKASPVVLGHSCVDEVIVQDRNWFVSPREWWKLRNRLRPLAIDVTIDCQGMNKTALAAWLSGAKHRIGCRGRYGCEFSPLLNNHLIEPRTTHLTDRSLELLAPLDARPQRVEFKLPIDSAAAAAVDAYLKELEFHRGFALINPGATWNSKLWVMERFGNVAQYLGSRYDLPTLVVWSGDRELGWAREIVAHSGGYATLARKTTLQELAAICRRAQIFIGSDTGPMHMAAAAGTPTVGLFGVSRVEDCGPYGSINIAIQECYQDGGRKQRRQADNRAMREIQVERVCTACDSILNSVKKSALKSA